MQRTTIALSLCACVLVFAVATLQANDEKDPREVVKEAMVAAHEGKKSPLELTKIELKKETPDWKSLAGHASAFKKAGEALKGLPFASKNPAPYVDAAAAFGKAVEAKDTEKTAKAFTSLTKTCGACHYGK